MRESVAVEKSITEHIGTNENRSGFFIYMNTALIQWFLKKQSTIETYVFGADFCDEIWHVIVV